MTVERILLQTVKFDLMIEHSYTYLLKFAKMVKGQYMHDQAQCLNGLTLDYAVHCLNVLTDIC